ncbi:MAG: ATP-grasp domain-containing protein [Candidatus Microsaccharimonas sp.]
MITPELIRSKDARPEGQINLWMERGFSRREIATRVKSAVPRISLFSTPQQPIDNTEILAFPVAKTPEAINAINTSIRENNIDVVWPQQSAFYDLTDIEAEVHAAAYPDTMRLVDDKTAFMEWLGNDQYRPFSAEAVGVTAIHNEFFRRHQQGHEVCIKPVIGVNGEGYWRLSETAGISLLNNPEQRTIHPDVYMEALAIEEEEKGPQRMVLMDYLPGPEVSVDLLTWNGEPLIHAARTKSATEPKQRIQSEHEVTEHSHDLARRLGFHGIISLQYRLDTEGNWKILEINPRPAGGSTHSEDAGFQIISNWAKLVARDIEPEDVRQHQGDVTLVSRPRWIVENPTI